MLRICRWELASEVIVGAPMMITVTIVAEIIIVDQNSIAIAVSAAGEVLAIVQVAIIVVPPVMTDEEGEGGSIILEAEVGAVANPLEKGIGENAVGIAEDTTETMRVLAPTIT